jgi:hypothetical protein
MCIASISLETQDPFWLNARKGNVYCKAKNSALTGNCLCIDVMTKGRKEGSEKFITSGYMRFLRWTTAAAPTVLYPKMYSIENQRIRKGKPEPLKDRISIPGLPGGPGTFSLVVVVDFFVVVALCYR